MKKHYETHVEDTDKLISVAGPVLDYKSWYEQYRKLMEEQAQRKHGLYTPTSEGDDDDFPSITGMIARYSASGLTNEQMAENPVWKDLTGNGHDLQMKNFAWKGMSGVGGYVADIDEWGTNSTAAYFERNSIKITATFKENVSLGLLYHNIKLRQSCVLKVTGIPEGCDAFLDDRLGNRFYMSEDGVYEIIPSNFLAEALYFSIEKYPERWYRSKLTIEQLPLYPGALVFDGVDDYGTCNNFPILTKEKGYTVVALRQWITYNPNAISAIATNASDQSFNGAFTFENYNKGAEQTISYGATQISLQYSKSPFSWQTTSKYNGFNIANGNKDATNSLVLGRSYPQRNEFANFAIWELVFLDHDATEEELTKIKDYFVKTYPWLFPDQAWTVTGKTNEDEDRATIANITGNGNDLVLSNFGFIEGSGYNKEGEYAGYLVTDGVDDEVRSAAFTLNEDWTIVGDWELLSNVQINCGIVKAQNVYLYNTANGLLISINNPRSLQSFGTKSLHAICSDGRLYDRNWVEYEYTVDQNFEIVKSSLNIGFNLNNHAQIAFKNLGIYDNQILSKDDCIKAYNYLQTLKSK